MLLTSYNIHATSSICSRLYENISVDASSYHYSILNTHCLFAPCVAFNILGLITKVPACSKGPIDRFLQCCYSGMPHSGHDICLPTRLLSVIAEHHVRHQSYLLFSLRCYPTEK